MVDRLNRMISGWARYFQLGQVSPAYVAVDAHASKRLRQWLCRKHKVRRGKFVGFITDRACGRSGVRCATAADGGRDGHRERGHGIYTHWDHALFHGALRFPGYVGEIWHASGTRRVSDWR